MIMYKVTKFGYQGDQQTNYCYKTPNPSSIKLTNRVSLHQRDLCCVTKEELNQTKPFIGSSPLYGIIGLL